MMNLVSVKIMLPRWVELVDFIFLLVFMLKMLQFSFQIGYIYFLTKCDV